MEEKEYRETALDILKQQIRDEKELKQQELDTLEIEYNRQCLLRNNEELFVRNKIKMEDFGYENPESDVTKYLSKIKELEKRINSLDSLLDKIK